MTIKELLTSEAYSHANYVVGLVNKNYNENDVLWFSMFSTFYNTDWMLDYLRTFVSKFPSKKCVIYIREDWANGTTKLYRVLSANINSKAFNSFINKGDYEVYKEKFQKTKIYDGETPKGQI